MSILFFLFINQDAVLYYILSSPMTKFLTKAAQGRTGLLMLLFEVQSIMVEKAWQKGTRQWVTLFPQLGSKRLECWYSAHFLHLTESRTPAPRMVPPHSQGGPSQIYQVCFHGDSKSSQVDDQYSPRLIVTPLVCQSCSNKQPQY